MENPPAPLPLLVVTGATKGIGRAVADRFIRAGFDAVICARMVDGVNGPHEIPFAADLSIRDDVRKLVDFIKSLNRPVALCW